MINKQDIVIFLGPPGSGKGSLSNLAIKKLGFEQVSTGNLCRYHIAQQTEIGKEIDSIIRSGKLISDDTITGMVTDWLLNRENKKTVILDGYPRTVNQADSLAKFAEKYSFDLSVVRLCVEDDRLIKRVVSRIVCSNTSCQRVFSIDSCSSNKPAIENVCDDCGSELVRRKDDTLEAIQKRLQVYRQHEAGLIDHFVSHSYKITEISAGQSLVSVYSDFVASFGAMTNDSSQKSSSH